MKNKMIAIAGAALMTLVLAQTVQATSISGNIGFTGQANMDTSSAGTATKVISWVSPVVNGTLGDFTGVPNGTAVTFHPNWSFNSGSLSPFWTISIGGFQFNLTSSSITSQGAGFVNVNGLGTVTGTGFTATSMNWSFGSQDPLVGTNPNAWTFSASTSSLVPDGGTTLTLLGMALSGVALLRKKLTA